MNSRTIPCIQILLNKHYNLLNYITMLLYHEYDILVSERHNKNPTKFAPFMQECQSSGLFHTRVLSQCSRLGNIHVITYMSYLSSLPYCHIHRYVRRTIFWYVSIIRNLGWTDFFQILERSRKLKSLWPNMPKTPVWRTVIDHCITTLPYTIRYCKVWLDDFHVANDLMQDPTLSNSEWFNMDCVI